MTTKSVRNMEHGDVFRFFGRLHAMIKTGPRIGWISIKVDLVEGVYAADLETGGEDDYIEAGLLPAPDSFQVIGRVGAPAAVAET